MDPDIDPIEDVEEYLTAIGGLWKELPKSLSISLRNLRAKELDEDLKTRAAIAAAREDAYQVSVRKMAKICKSYNG